MKAAFTYMPINTIPHHPEFWGLDSVVFYSRFQSLLPQRLAHSAAQDVDSDG